MEPTSSPAPSLAPRLARGLLLTAIRTYQYSVSAVFGPCCRFTPTCSHYGYEAVSRFGAVRGGWLALKRIARCHPWHLGGDDPVPQTWPVETWPVETRPTRHSLPAPHLSGASADRPRLTSVERIRS